MEQISPGTISKHIKDKNAIGSSQQAFIKGKSCLTNLLAFYDKMPSLVDEGREVGAVSSLEQGFQHSSVTSL